MPTVRIGDQICHLAPGAPAGLSGALIPGHGARVLLTAPSFERSDCDHARAFAVAVQRCHPCRLMAASWDAPAVIATAEQGSDSDRQDSLTAGRSTPRDDRPNR